MTSSTLTARGGPVAQQPHTRASSEAAAALQVGHLGTLNVRQLQGAAWTSPPRVAGGAQPVLLWGCGQLEACNGVWAGAGL